MNWSRKTGWIAMLLAVLLTLSVFAPQAMAADYPTAAYYKTVEVKYAFVAIDAMVNVRMQPNTDSRKLGRLNKGEGCQIIGESGDWWQIDYNGENGYVLKELMEVHVVVDDAEMIVEDPLEASFSGLTAPGILQYQNDYKVNGVVVSNIPLVEVVVEIYNLRTLTVDRSAAESFKREDNVYEYDLSNLAKKLSFNEVDPGEKKLIVRVSSANETAVVSETFFYVYMYGAGTQYTEEVHMTDDCKIYATTGKVKKLTDRNYKNGIVLDGEDDSITVTLPADRIPEGLLLCWVTAPDNVTITQLDADGNAIETINETNDSDMIHFYYELLGNTREIVITTTDDDRELCELRVYEMDKVADTVQQWEELPEKVDLLVVSTHQDDELLFFGGTIPYYIAQGKTVAVVYMANCSRNRYAEALDGLWSCGLKYHPIFVGFVDKRINDYQETVNLWGMETTENALVDIIRKYQPEVIVTHDVNGEYGHNQHKVTCAAVQSAVTKAGDPAISTQSAEQYGTWTPKKLYIHLYEDNALLMDVYDDPEAGINGLSMTQIATIGYSKHVSQQNYYTMEVHGVKYDNRKYGLAFTTVGEDVEKNDFFENID